MDSTGLDYGPDSSSCEHGNELSDSNCIKFIDWLRNNQLRKIFSANTVGRSTGLWAESQYIPWLPK
jgi:hypothetical protein